MCAGAGFLMAPLPKPVVVHCILSAQQVVQRAGADHGECCAWMRQGQSTGWGGNRKGRAEEEEEEDNRLDEKKQEDGKEEEEEEEEAAGVHRIRVTGDQELDDAIALEHEMYKATGSVEVRMHPSSMCTRSDSRTSLTHHLFAWGCRRRPGSTGTSSPAWCT